jgi:hypothetical protein
MVVYATNLSGWARIGPIRFTLVMTFGELGFHCIWLIADSTGIFSNICRSIHKTRIARASITDCDISKKYFEFWHSSYPSFASMQTAFSLQSFLSGFSHSLIVCIHSEYYWMFLFYTDKIFLLIWRRKRTSARQLANCLGNIRVTGMAMAFVGAKCVHTGCIRITVHTCFISFVICYIKLESKILIGNWLEWERIRVISLCLLQE